MKKTFLFLSLLFAVGLVFAQTTINFDDAAKWTAGSALITSYASDHVYADGVFSATGGPALRNTTTAQDGYAGALGTYAWRLTNAAADWRITIASGGVSTFSIDLRRWDNSPTPAYNLDYSTDGGSNWTLVTAVNNTTLDNLSAWKTFNGTINSASTNILIRLVATGTTERIMADNFVWTGYTASNPTIGVNPASLTGFTYVLNAGPSAAQSFALTGSNLTANLGVAASTNYLISTSENGTYGSSLSFTPSGGSVSTTVYVRLKAGLAIGDYNGETITASSTGATPQNVTCSGSVTAPPPPTAPTATAATSVGNTSFTANWNAVSGATGYYLDVYTMAMAPGTLTEGFDNGLTVPEGWTFTGITGTYTTAGNFGVSSPSLKFDTTGDIIETPLLNNPTSLSFWIKGQTTDASSALLVEEFDGTSWSTIENIVPLPTTGTTKNYTLSSGTTKVRFTYTKSAGNLAFDDVSISLTTLTLSYVTGYQNLNVNNVTTYNVTGLSAGTTYYYVVRAYNTYGTSGDSNEITVTTTSTSPLITVSPATLTGFTYMEGSGPSDEKIFTISGSNLTGNISIAATTNYEISTGTGASFVATNPVTLTQSGGTVGTTTIYVRLKAGLTAGDYNSEAITASSTGATSQTVTCSGTVTAIPDPTLTVSVTTLSGFSYIVGAGPSASMYFTVSGTYLTGDIEVTAPTSYEVSGDDVTFAGSITLTAAKLDVAETTLYVRLKAGLAIGHYAEDLTVSTAGATDETIALSGDVLTDQVPFCHWNFNTSPPTAPANWTAPIASDSGDGELTYTFTNATSYAGNTLNAAFGDAAGGSFAPVAGTGLVNNGEELVLAVDTTDRENIVMSYATRGTATGFYSQTIYYSLDGGANYILFDTLNGMNVTTWTVQTLDFSAITGANDNPGFMVKIVLDGATSDSGNNRFDNILFFGDEPINPVELASFTATISAQNYITLTWVTQTETGMRGYYLFRDSDKNFAGAQIVSPMIAASNSTQQQTYFYEDTEVYDSGTYYYWLQANDLDGAVAIHGPVSVYYNALGDNPTPEIPLVTELKSVYPNPFNPLAFIPFSLAKDSNVSFKIYNARGQIVKHFELGSKAAGNYRITWDGTDYNGAALSNGVYQIVMTAGSQVYQTKTTLLK